MNITDNKPSGRALKNRKVLIIVIALGYPLAILLLSVVFPSLIAFSKALPSEGDRAISFLLTAIYCAPVSITFFWLPLTQESKVQTLLAFNIIYFLLMYLVLMTPIRAFLGLAITCSLKIDCL